MRCCLSPEASRRILSEINESKGAQKMLGQHLTHANFSVDDLAAAKIFYVDKLGFTAEKHDEFAVLLKSGAGTRVLVYHKPDHQAWDSTVLGIEVDDVKAAVGELRTSGISIEKLDGTDDDGIMTIPNMGEAAWFRDLQETGSA